MSTKYPKRLTQLLSSKEGQSTVEYATMLTLLLMMAFIMHAVGTEARTLFSWVVSIFQ